MPELQIENIIPVLIQWGMTSGLKVLFILVAMYIAMKIAHKVVSRLISSTIRKTYDHRGEAALKKREATLHKIAHMAVKALIIAVGGLMVLAELGMNTAPLLGAAGIAGLALGFGGQYLIRDLISGLFIIIEDQYRVGDVIKVAGVSGVVEAITLRDTVLRDLDGIEHHVPNGEINTVSNYTKFWARAHLNIGVAYSTNLEHATEVLNRVGKEMAEDEKWKDDFITPVEVVGVDEFGDSAIEIKILGDTKPMRQWDVMRELRRRIKIAFDKEGIEIPFPQRTVWMKKEGE